MPILANLKQNRFFRNIIFLLRIFGCSSHANQTITVCIWYLKGSLFMYYPEVECFKVHILLDFPLAPPPSPLLVRLCSFWERFFWFWYHKYYNVITFCLFKSLHVNRNVMLYFNEQFSEKKPITNYLHNLIINYIISIINYLIVVNYLCWTGYPRISVINPILFN